MQRDSKINHQIRYVRVFIKGVSFPKCIQCPQILVLLILLDHIIVKWQSNYEQLQQSYIELEQKSYPIVPTAPCTDYSAPFPTSYYCTKTSKMLKSLVFDINVLNLIYYHYLMIYYMNFMCHNKHQSDNPLKWESNITWLYIHKSVTWQVNVVVINNIHKSDKNNIINWLCLECCLVVTV